MQADILLTHSYFLRFDPKEYRAMMPYPPLGTMIAASVLRNAGFRVAIHDVMLSEREEELQHVLDTVRPKLVVIYDDSFNYLTKMCLSRMREAAFRMAALAKSAGSVTAVFSSDATDHIEAYVDHGIDYVICGEAESTVTELARFVTGRSSVDPASIDGLAFLREGSIVRNSRRELIRDLDTLPFPAWDLVDVEQYRTVWKRRHGYFSVNVSTTRGCPFHCNWCAKPLYGQVYHSRSPEHVVREMEFLKEQVRPDHIWITDDIFGLKPGWIPRFQEEVNRRNARIPFKCLSRADLLLKEDSVRHLALAGCTSVWIGAESGSQRVLDAMEKGTTVAQIRDSARLLHEAGIRVGFFLQFGYPGESRDDIEKTLDMVKECSPDEIGISVSYPLPGTKFFERVKARLGDKQNWVDSQDLDLMFPGEFHPDFYRALHKVVHKKFSVWRGQKTVRSLFRQKAKVHRSRLRAVAAMIYHATTLPLSLRKLEAAQQLRMNS